jgi:hypothetical protein
MANINQPKDTSQVVFSRAHNLAFQFTVLI